MGEPWCCEFGDLTVGKSSTFAKTLTEADVAPMGIGLGHTTSDQAANRDAATVICGTPMMQEILSISILSAAMARILPSPGSIYLSQSLSFSLEMQVGDTIEAIIKITSISLDWTCVLLDATCSVNQIPAISIGAQVLLLAPSRYWFGSAADLADHQQAEVVLAHDHEQLARLHDVSTTELRFGEAGLRLCVEASTARIFRVGSNGAFAYVFPATASIFGRDSRNQGIENPLQQSHPEDQPAVEALHTRLINRVVESDTLTFRVLDPDRCAIWVEAQTRSLLDCRTGTPDGYVAVLRNLNRRNRRNDDLPHARHLDEIGRIAAVVAHNINHTLTSVIESLELTGDHAKPKTELELISGNASSSAKCSRYPRQHAPLNQRLRPEIVELPQISAEMPVLLFTRPTSPDIPSACVDLDELQATIAQSVRTGGALSLDASGPGATADRVEQLVVLRVFDTRSGRCRSPGASM